MIAPPGLMLYFWVYVEVLGWLWIAGWMLWLSSWCWAVGMIPTLDCCEPHFAILCGSSDGPLLYRLQFSVCFPSVWILTVESLGYSGVAGPSPGLVFLSKCWQDILVEIVYGYDGLDSTGAVDDALGFSYPLCWQLALPVTSPLPLPTLYLS